MKKNGGIFTVLIVVGVEINELKSTLTTIPLSNPMSINIEESMFTEEKLEIGIGTGK